MAFQWLVYGVVRLSEFFLTFLYPVYATLGFLAQAHAKEKPRYKSFVQWSTYWPLFVLLNLFDPSVLHVPQDFHIMLNFCKVFVLILLGYPKLNGAQVFYNEFFEDPLFRVKLRAQKNWLAGIVLGRIRGWHAKYQGAIRRFNRAAGLWIKGAKPEEEKPAPAAKTGPEAKVEGERKKPAPSASAMLATIPEEKRMKLSELPETKSPGPKTEEQKKPEKKEDAEELTISQILLGYNESI